MNIEIFSLGINQTNCYVVWDSGEGLVIDPADHPDLIIEFVKKKSIDLRYVINTHGHFDHIMGNNLLVSSTSAKLLVGKYDEEMISNPFQNLSAYFAKPFYSLKPATVLHDGDRISIGEIEFTIIHTPGHTPGGICIYSPHWNVVFTGDTLFRFSYGRTDLVGGNERDILLSLGRLLSILRDDDICFPGHGDSFRFGDVRGWLERLIGL
ncbi:MAG: MBL fold metallo-hydrolase [Brevinematales bacterium]|nr:MBL fold metallo-hydrolase [Brevinematales bacterium]